MLALISLTAASCATSLYGVAFTDKDGDGYAAEAGDCDDDDREVHPDAEEIPEDGIDSNCDGDDDT